MKKIDNIFSGVLDLSKDNQLDAAFCVNDTFVTVIPLTDKCRKKIFHSDDFDNQEEKVSWIYGIAEDSCRVAFLKNKSISPQFSLPVDIGTGSFSAPIILKSDGPYDVDISAFDIIEFRGGILNLLHMTGKAIDERYSENQLIFQNKNTYTHSFPTIIDDIKLELEYSISLSGIYTETGQVPNLKDGCQSVFRFKFDSPQPLEDFKKYYIYALNLFQFCAGCMNIKFDVSLYKEISDNKGKRHIAILSKIYDGFDDYAYDRLKPVNVIRFDFIKPNISNLLKLLNESKTEPYLLFLPKSNKNYNHILYTDINDLCVALEREYAFSHDFNKQDREDAKNLSVELLQVVQQSKYPDHIKSKAENIICGNLKNYNLSLKEKIYFLCDIFFDAMKSITEPETHVQYGLVKEYTIKEFKEKIGEFVKIRNRASHYGIAWNDGVEIYYHLCLLVYFSVLKRAGYTIDESRCMLSYLFSRRF